MGARSSPAFWALIPRGPRSLFPYWIALPVCRSMAAKDPAWPTVIVAFAFTDQVARPLTTWKTGRTFAFGVRMALLVPLQSASRSSSDKIRPTPRAVMRGRFERT